MTTHYISLETKLVRNCAHVKNFIFESIFNMVCTQSLNKSICYSLQKNTEHLVTVQKNLANYKS